MDMIQREIWVDYMKVIACILVVIGHFYQSMVTSGIMVNGNFYNWFDTTIYYIHIQMFFLASGYLYQKSGKITTTESHIKNIGIKIIDLGIPYIFFSTITYILKVILSNSVNNGVQGSLAYALINDPISPYWFLYALFMCFLIYLVINSTKRFMIFALITCALKFISILGLANTPLFAVNIICKHGIWFFLGMVLYYLNGIEYFRSREIAFSYIFIPLSFIITIGNVSEISSTLMTIIGLTMMLHVCILISNKSYKIIGIISNNFMTIYLMHTIFAACVRIALIKLGIYISIIHVILGLTVSFAAPIIIGYFGGMIKIINLFFYPTRTIISMKKKV